MSHYSMIGASIVIFALASYSISIFTEQIKKTISRFILTYLTAGIVLDITATLFMIMGSSKGALTLHGILGYSALAAMLIDTLLIWRFYKKHDLGTQVAKGLHLYSRFAYIYWVVAFITGILLVVFR